MTCFQVLDICAFVIDMCIYIYLFSYRFLPLDASIKHGLCRHVVSVCLSVL